MDEYALETTFFAEMSRREMAKMQRAMYGEVDDFDCDSDMDSNDSYDRSSEDTDPIALLEEEFLRQVMGGK